MFNRSFNSTDLLIWTALFLWTLSLVLSDAVHVFYYYCAESDQYMVESSVLGSWVESSVLSLQIAGTYSKLAI